MSRLFLSSCHVTIMSHWMLRVTLAAAALTIVWGACLTAEWKQFRDKCYWMSNYTLTWEDATKICPSIFPGAHLVSVHDIEEDGFVSEEVTGYIHTWLGLHCTGCRDYPPSGCTWSDGSAYNYSNWFGNTGRWDGECCAFNNYGNQGACIVLYCIIVLQT